VSYQEVDTHFDLKIRTILKGELTARVNYCPWQDVDDTSWGHVPFYLGCRALGTSMGTMLKVVWGCAHFQVPGTLEPPVLTATPLQHRSPHCKPLSGRPSLGFLYHPKPLALGKKQGEGDLLQVGSW
jgi:hypothetical protein